MSLSDDLQISLLETLNDVKTSLADIKQDVGEMKGTLSSLVGPDGRVQRVEKDILIHDEKLEELQHRSWWRDGAIAGVATILSAIIHFLFPPFGKH